MAMPLGESKRKKENPLKIRFASTICIAEGNTRLPVSGKGVKNRRSQPKTVACRKRLIQELGKPLNCPSKTVQSVC